MCAYVINIMVVMVMVI